MATIEKQELLLLDDPLLPLIHFGDEARFVALFQSSGSQIPHNDRRAICSYWGVKNADRIPYCELSNLWQDDTMNYGQVTGNGYELRFSAAAFEILPREVARFIIAHELAHVFQKAEGKRPGGESEEENEVDADGIAERWGFCGYWRRTFAVLVAKCGFEKACKLIDM